MVCRYCGLETGSGVGHRSQAECIIALNDEIARARQLIDRVRCESHRRAVPFSDQGHAHRAPADSQP
jgi:hypothetical protein